MAWQRESNNARHPINAMLNNYGYRNNALAGVMKNSDHNSGDQM